MKETRIEVPAVELSALDVAARLTERMQREGSGRVAEQTHLSIAELYQMIELHKPFSRAVLRALGIRRMIRYYEIF